MGGFSNFAVSFSVISILTGATQLYGYGLAHGGPLQITAGWWLVSFFTLTVALAMAELASAYPTAGALYHWATWLGGKRMGWFTACFNTIGQFAILAGIDYGLAMFLVSPLKEFAGITVDPRVLYVGLLLSHAILNHVGIRVVAWLNNFSAWYHIAVVALILACLAMAGFRQPPEFLLHFKASDGYSPGYSFLIGLLLAQWTLTGYDASAHVSEETVNPRKNAPWGIFLAVVISVVFGSLMLSAITLSIPDLDQAVGFGDGALTEIFRMRLGSGLASLLIFLIAGAMWLCGVASLTSASRMVYAFARDGGLPMSSLWARVSPRFRTPAHAIWGITVLAAVLVSIVDLLSAVVSMAVISLYLSYGLPVLARLRVRFGGQRDEIGPWNLGRWSTANACVAVAWIATIMVLFVLPPNQMVGKLMSILLAALVALWVLYVRHHFKGPKVHFFDRESSQEES
jgi:amino acid transporter